MREENIKIRIERILEKINKLSLNGDYKSELKIKELYRMYLKLMVLIQRNIPEFDNGLFNEGTTCYLYALDLDMPDSIAYFKDDFDYAKYNIDLGNISGYMYPFNKENKPTENDILNLLAKDLKYLKIKSYPSTINSPCTHCGYKIAIFLEDARNYDYHFVRQNADGSWSAKLGNEDLVVQSDNPLAYLNQNIYSIPTYYKYIKTLELVKPRVK